MRVPSLGKAPPPHPSACCRPVGLVLSAQCMGPSRAAWGGPAVLSVDAWGAMCRRTITIGGPQQGYCSLERSLNAVSTGGGMLGVLGPIEPGVCPMYPCAAAQAAGGACNCGGTSQSWVSTAIPSTRRVAAPATKSVRR